LVLLMMEALFTSLKYLSEAATDIRFLPSLLILRVY
jgi:hypothetical protein